MTYQDQPLDHERIERLWDSCPLGHLRMAGRIVTQIYDEVLKPTGLKSTQFSLLSTIAILSPTTISLVANRTATDRTTLTRNLKPLAAAGFITLAQGEDRRTRTITLTPEGERLLAKSLHLWEQAQSAIVTELGERWRRELLGSLSAVVSLMDG